MLYVRLIPDPLHGVEVVDEEAAAGAPYDRAYERARSYARPSFALEAAAGLLLPPFASFFLW